MKLMNGSDNDDNNNNVNNNNKLIKMALRFTLVTKLPMKTIP